MANTYSTDVFINCPFDRKYQPIFDAVVFAVFDCGFRARCARELDDASEVRIEKIANIIRESRFGIHDLSRTELDEKSRLPRFNMPLELGMFLAAKRFGDATQRRKVALILDRRQYRYQRFISDIAGQDIRCHENRPNEAIRTVRNWLSSASRRRRIPGGTTIRRRYAKFRKDLPKLCDELGLDREDLTFNDFCSVVAHWLELAA